MDGGEPALIGQTATVTVVHGCGALCSQTAEEAASLAEGLGAPRANKRSLLERDFYLRLSALGQNLSTARVSLPGGGEHPFGSAAPRLGQ